MLSIWNRPWCSTTAIQRPSRGTDAHEPRSSHWSSVTVRSTFLFRVWVMIFGAMILLEIEVSNQALAVKFPWPGRKQNTRTRRCNACPTDAQWGRRVRFQDRAHSKYSLALYLEYSCVTVLFLGTSSGFFWVGVVGGRQSPFRKH